MRLRFTLPASVSAYRTAPRARLHLRAQTFRRVHSPTSQHSLVTGTVTFGTGRTYQQGTSRIDSAVYAMTH